MLMTHRYMVSALRSPDDTQALQNRGSVCIGDVDKWMASNRLQLNAAKTEVLWCASNRQQHLVPSDPFSVCGDTVKPAKSVRDLGIFLDNDMSMKTHVSRTVSSCFAALRQIRSIRRSVSFTLSRHLVCAVALILWQCKPHRNISTIAGSSAVSA